MFPLSAIICAYNEEPTVGEVGGLARRKRG